MEQLLTLAWQYRAGLVPNEELPIAAAHLLVAGLDSPALRELAGLSRSDSNAELFPVVLGEFGTALPDQDITECCVLHHVADRLVAGAMTPSQVAAEVWRRLFAGWTEAERDFVDAVGYEYHVDLIAAERPEAFRVWEKALRSAAERLCRTPFPTW
ncbi:MULTISPECIES: hypothetical protein [unclassified Kitasatospora]|uniref:hypothetical protein n=1 Tax=unclassified Kitasatospora TaxID=2633591 RepID=UPI0033C3895B